MTLLCLEYKAVSVEYFLDKMQFYELDALLDNLNYCVRNEWETARSIMWASISPYSKKKLKPKDIMEFPWEKPKKLQLPKQEVTQEVVDKAFALAEKRKQALLKAGVLN